MFNEFVVHISFSRNILHNVSRISSVNSVSTQQTTCKMRLRRNFIPLDENNTDIRKRRNVNQIEIISALYELIASRSTSILQINDEHYKILAKRFKISQNIVKRAIMELQPKLTIRKMYLFCFLFDVSNL